MQRHASRPALDHRPPEELAPGHLKEHNNAVDPTQGTALGRLRQQAADHDVALEVRLPSHTDDLVETLL